MAIGLKHFFRIPSKLKGISMPIFQDKRLSFGGVSVEVLEVIVVLKSFVNSLRPQTCSQSSMQHNWNFLPSGGRGARSRHFVHNFWFRFLEDLLNATFHSSQRRLVIEIAYLCVPIVISVESWEYLEAVGNI